MCYAVRVVADREVEVRAAGAMTRTVLFFGDSNTRGYGVGRDSRYAALVETAMPDAVETGWRFQTATTASDFRLIATRLDTAIAAYRPAIIVWTCPTGPLAYYVREPQWYKRLRKRFRRRLHARQERIIQDDIARGGGEDTRPRREAVYEGRYLDELYRGMPRNWPGMRWLRPLFAARYGTIVKATEGQYYELMRRHRERVRRATDATLLFCSVFPHSEYAYPGFNARASAWNAGLSRLLHEPGTGSTFVDVYGPLTRRRPHEHLLRDGMHLSSHGHRIVADVLVPEIRALMRAYDARAVVSAAARYAAVSPGPADSRGTADTPPMRPVAPSSPGRSAASRSTLHARR